MRPFVLQPSRSFPLFFLLGALGCGDDSPSVDAAVDASEVPLDLGALEDMPEVRDEGIGPDLAPDLGTPCDGPPGLYVDAACTVLAEGIESYNPQYWLWSDGTDKQRFVSLPEGTTIDTTDPDNWVYPVGTRLWKTFLTPDALTRLETRLIEKLAEGTGPDFWEMRTFVWNAAQDAVEEVLGGMADVLGTGHDIPSQAQCLECHASPGRNDVVNGFTAIQLNHGDTALSLDQLNLRGALSEPIALSAARVASDGDSRYAAGLGYLHANCGSCHGNAGARAGMKLWSNVGTASFAESNVAIDAVGVTGSWALLGATARIEPGLPEQSAIFIRNSSREPGIRMPPLGTEVVDPGGQETLRAFIAALGG